MKKNSSESESERPTTSGVPEIPNQVSWTFSSVLSVLFQGIPVWVSLFWRSAVFTVESVITHDYGGLHFQGGDILKCCISLACVSWLTLWNQSCLSRFSLHQSSVLSLSVAPVRVWLRLKTLNLVNSDLLSSSPVSSFNVTVLFCVCLLYIEVYWQSVLTFSISDPILFLRFMNVISLLATEDLLLKITQWLIRI